MRLLLYSLFCVFLSVVKSAVIGIDLGTNFYKISLIAPGKTFVIVESQASKRKTETSLAFVNNKRFYETDALNKRTRYPQNTFAFVNKFLGALETDQEVFEVSKAAFDEYKLSFTKQRGTVQFEINNWKFDNHDEEEDATVVLKVEEVFAMMLNYAKKLSESMGKTSIKDCVVSIPAHWGPNQRMALSNAISITGLVPLTFITDNTAAALYYGLERNDVNKTHTVMFYNLGATNLQVSVIEFNAVNKTKSAINSSLNSTTRNTVESVRVLADYVIENVGGIEYDKVIANYFAEVIDARPSRKGKPSIKENKRTMRRITRECVKVKEILSANKQSLYSSEGLFDGLDFQATISRQEFEERSQHLLDQLTVPIDKVLERANITLQDVDIVELLGGGTRIPKIQQILQEKVGELEVGTHMNGDESTALGASYQAANFSRSFRIRDILLADGYNFGVKAEITNLDQTEESSPDYYHKSFTLFPIKKRFGTKKSVNFANKNNVKVNLFTVDYEGNQTPYAQFNLTNIDKVEKDTHYNETVKPKIHLEFEISSLEGILLQEAQVKFNYTMKEKIPEKELKKLEKEAKKKEKKEKKDKKTEKTTDKSDKEEDKETQNVNNTTSPILDGEAAQNKTIQYRYKNKTRSITIDINEQYYGIQPFNKSEIRKSKRVISRFDLYEERQRNLSDIKNKFESYIYRVRDFLEDDFYIKYSTEQEIKNLTDLREFNAEWLDSDEAFEGNFTVYADKLKEMEDLSFPTLIRLEEARLRPEYVNKTIQAIETFQAKTSQLEKENKWLNETQIAPLKNIIKETVQWLNSSLAKQKELKENEDPAFSIQECKPKVDEINKIYNQVKSIKEPKKAEDKKSKKGKKTSFKIDGENVEIDLEELMRKENIKKKKMEDILKKAQENMNKAKQTNDGEAQPQEEEQENKSGDEGSSGSEKEEKKTDL